MASSHLSPTTGEGGDNRFSMASQAPSQRSVSVPTSLTINNAVPPPRIDSPGGPRSSSLARPASAMTLGVGGHSPASLGSRASSALLAPGMAHNRSSNSSVMDTNNSSIVSKRSVEKLYYAGEPEYFRFFVSKFKRRSPLINRGYWLRMRAIEHAVARFLAEPTSKTKLVINLGCGYDPLPFSFLGKQRELCENTLFVDVDFPLLMKNKVGIVSSAEPLSSLIPDLTVTNNETGLLATSVSYAAIGCDLRDIDTLRTTLQEHFQVETSPVSIMFVAEVSIAYMEAATSQAVLEWAATYPDVRFTLLEQQIPDGYDHPFAITMMSHFNKLRTPLHSLGTMEQMRDRFVAAGWPEAATEAHSLWELWSEPAFMSAELRRWLDTVEPFDEWEEFAIFATHYFLLVAERKSDKDYQYMPYRASFSANRLSMMPNPSNPGTSASDTSNLDPNNLLVAQELPTSHVPRRYAALTPSPLRGQDGDAFGLHGGLGMQERRDDCDTYSWFETAQLIDGPPLRAGIMCHTVTRLGGTNNCMLAGGRTSPDKALSDCWLRQDGLWSKVASFPEGRYRHCAVPLRLPTEPRPAHTVLVYGGKASDGHVLDEWLLWTGEQGWQNLRVVGDHPCARFGAAMITDKAEGISGIIIGGLTSAGRVLNDFWHWNLQPDMSVTCQNVTPRATSVLRNNIWILGRFGAQLVRSDQGILLVGGVAGGRLLTRNDQILNMRTLRTTPVRGARQLYVGCSIQNVDGGILILGGGATCFSFGTFWNKGCMLTPPSQRRDDNTWQLISNATASSHEPKTLIIPSGAMKPSDDISSPSQQSRSFSPPDSNRGSGEPLHLPAATVPSHTSVYEPGSAITTPAASNGAPIAATIAAPIADGFVAPPRPVIEVTQNGAQSGRSSPRSPRLMDTADRGLNFSSPTRMVPRRAVGEQTSTFSSPTSSIPRVEVSQTGSAFLPTPATVARVQLNETNPFQKHLEGAKPIIITGASFGRCTQFWSDNYLKEAVGSDREVVVHSSNDEKMDFQSKNFSYVTQSFSDFLDAAARGERVYLRSLSREQPSKKPTSLSEDFPELAPDFQMPIELAHIIASTHSSPLRISGPVTMWLHYDVMDNILVQIRGRKRVLLFPPSDVTQLGFSAGASSSSLDVFHPSPSTASILSQTRPHEAILEPGEALFIPSTWAHSATPLDNTSVAVNCFFRGMDPATYAAGRDVYGNRDVAAYERGRKDVARIVKSFEELPPHVAGFYMERLAMELMEKARTTTLAAGEGLHSTYQELA